MANGLLAHGVLLGLTAALCWGVADYCLRGATHAAGTFRALYFMQVVGLLAFLGVLLVHPLSFAQASGAALLAAVALNLLILVGAALLYRSFAIGKLAVVSPIAASFGAIATILALFAGERPSAAQLIGLALLLVGVTLSSMTHSPPHAASAADEPYATHRGKRLLGPGVAEALGATVIFGVSYWALRYVVAQVGATQVAMIGKASDLTALTLVALLGWGWQRFGRLATFAQGTATAAPRALAPRSAIFWRWLIPGALLDAAANAAYNIGVSGALTSVVATLSSLFTAVTVLLAWVFLRERLTRAQWAGVAVILVGIALVNL